MESDLFFFSEKTSRFFNYETGVTYISQMQCYYARSERLLVDHLYEPLQTSQSIVSASLILVEIVGVQSLIRIVSNGINFAT